MDLMLAQAAKDIGIGAGGVTLLALFALLVKRGVSGNFRIGGESKALADRADQVGRDHSNGLCPLHREFEARLDERHEAIKGSLDDLKDAIGQVHQDIVSLHQRLDEVLHKE